MVRRKRAAPSEPLSGYRLMWVMVMFDLPVDTEEARKAAHDFREDLKDLGFSMAQYSVYLRHAASRDDCERYIERIRGMLPEGGRVYIHCLTDKQYEQIIHFERRQKQAQLKNPEQFELF